MNEDLTGKFQDFLNTCELIEQAIASQIAYVVLKHPCGMRRTLICNSSHKLPMETKTKITVP